MVRNDDESKGIALLAMYWALRGAGGSSPTLLSAWVEVIPAQSPFTITTNAIAVDCRTDLVQLLLPNIDGFAVVITDEYAASASHPILITDTHGHTIWNPSNPGQYLASVPLADPSGSPVRLKLSIGLGRWIPW